MYFHVSIIPSHRRFLQFVVNHLHYQFTVLPFSILVAPQVFAKSMGVMAAYQRMQQVQLFPYQDDWLMNSQSRAQVEDHVSLVHMKFLRIGLILNIAKSTIIPIQRTEFIGALLDSTQPRAFLPEAHFLAMSAIIKDVSRFPTMTAQSCLK